MIQLIDFGSTVLTGRIYRRARTSTGDGARIRNAIWEHKHAIRFSAEEKPGFSATAGLLRRRNTQELLIACLMEYFRSSCVPS
jgi:hypothetical protein